MTMITPSYLGETIEYSSLHACRSTLEDPTKTGYLTIYPYALPSLSTLPCRLSVGIEDSFLTDCWDVWGRPRMRRKLFFLPAKWLRNDGDTRMFGQTLFQAPALPSNFSGVDNFSNTYLL